MGACNSALHDELMSERGCEKIAREHCDSVGARLEWMTWRAFLFALYERAVFTRGMYGSRAHAVTVLITQSRDATAQAVFDTLVNDSVLNMITRWVRGRREFRCATTTRNTDGVLCASNWAHTRVRMLLRGDIIRWFPEFRDREREQFRRLCAATDDSVSLMFIWDGVRAIRAPYGMIPAEFTARDEFSATYFEHTGAIGQYNKIAVREDESQQIRIAPFRELRST